MRNQHVTPGTGRHAWRALFTGAALVFPVTIACAEDPPLAKSSRLQNEVLKPSPHEGQLTPPHMSTDWWLRIRREVSQGDDTQSSKQVFVRREDKP